MFHKEIMYLVAGRPEVFSFEDGADVIDYVKVGFRFEATFNVPAGVFIPGVNYREVIAGTEPGFRVRGAIVLDASTSITMAPAPRAARWADSPVIDLTTPATII